MHCAALTPIDDSMRTVRVLVLAIIALNCFAVSVRTTSSGVAGQSLPVSTKTLAKATLLMRTLRNSVARLRSARTRMVSETEDEVGGSDEKVNSRGEPEPMGPRLLDVRLG